MRARIGCDEDPSINRIDLECTVIAIHRESIVYEVAPKPFTRETQRHEERYAAELSSPAIEEISHRF